LSLILHIPPICSPFSLPTLIIVTGRGPWLLYRNDV
jgi:hypothetical protein